MTDDEVDALTDDKREAVRVELGRGGQRYRVWRPHFATIDQCIAAELEQRLFGLLHKPAEVEAREVQLISCGEYLQGLRLPTSLNICSMAPLQGNVLISLDANLVYSLVDSFFGGGGRSTDLGGREFSKTEMSVTSQVLELVINGIRAGWKRLGDSSFDLLGSETNPAACKAFTATELMVLRRFKIEFSGGGGGVDILLPAPAVDGLLGETPVALPAQAAQQFLQQRSLAFQATVSGELGGATVTLRQLLELSAGDIIPIGSPEEVDVKVNGVTKFTARVGEQGGRVGLCILGQVKDSRS